MPRWFLICLITVTVSAPIAAGAWYWIQRPKHVLAMFVSLVAAHDFERANSVLDRSCQFRATTQGHVALTGTREISLAPDEWSGVFDQRALIFEPRTIPDKLQCRLRGRFGEKCLVKVDRCQVLITLDRISGINRRFQLSNITANDAVTALSSIFATSPRTVTAIANNVDSITVRADLETIPTIEELVNRLDR
jgi:hypothetical protein